MILKTKHSPGYVKCQQGHPNQMQIPTKASSVVHLYEVDRTTAKGTQAHLVVADDSSKERFELGIIYTCTSFYINLNYT